MTAFSKRVWLFGALALVPAALMACSVPVFQYALDHWRPDDYQVFVYHDQELSEQDQARLQDVRDQAAAAGANLQLRTIDLREELDSADRQRWEHVSALSDQDQDDQDQDQGDAALPRMVVNLPANVAGGEAIVGTAAWNDEEVERLIDSPARIELGERLIEGEVVWVYLESGSAADDEIRFELLRGELDKQQQTLELPEIDPDDLDELSGDAEELAVRFSAMRISRDDPAEKWFREMLLSTEPDLRDEELVDQAMVFPVFGRGRALYALVGDGINPDVIQEAAVFLTGACQCTVKAENPGVDLLLPVRWDQYIQPPEPDAVDLPLVGLAGMVSDDSDETTGEPGAQLASADRPETSDAASEASAAAAVASNSSPQESGSRQESGSTVPSESTAPIDAPASATEESAEGSPAREASSAGSATVVAIEGPDWLRWLPWGVLATLGLIVLISGITLMRRQERS